MYTQKNVSLALIVVYFILYFFPSFLLLFPSNFYSNNEELKKRKKTESDTYTIRQYNMCVVSLCVTLKKHQRGIFLLFWLWCEALEKKKFSHFLSLSLVLFRISFIVTLQSVVVVVAETHNTPATFFSQFYIFFLCDFKNFFSIDAAWLCQLSM